MGPLVDFINPAIRIALPLLALAFVSRDTRPATPTPRERSGVPSFDELGPETPALVDLLTGGYTLDSEAFAATIVDLSARGHITTSEHDGKVLLQPTRQDAPLTPYEDRALTFVEKSTIGGTVPANALRFDNDVAADRWWRRFTQEVSAHAIESGLARARYTATHLWAVWGAFAGAALLPVIVAWYRYTTPGAGPVESPSGVSTLTWSTVVLNTVSFAVVFIVAAMVYRVMTHQTPTSTPAGIAAAERWLGIREVLDDTGSFSQRGAGAVVVWDRYLAYAIGLGLAPYSHRQIRLPGIHGTHVWSCAQGRWRRINLRRRALPFGASTPSRGVVLPLISLVAMTGLAWLATSAVIEIRGLVTHPEAWVLGLFGIAPIFAGALALVVAWNALIALVVVVIDSAARFTTTGVVVRLREYNNIDNYGTSYVQMAIDDGRPTGLPVLTAQRRMVDVAGIEVGSRVTATAGRIGRVVTSIDRA